MKNLCNKNWIIELIIILVLILPLAGLYGQVEIYGYFEPQYAGYLLNRDYNQTGYGKLRIDLKNTENKNVRFGADLIYLHYFGLRHWNILDFLPDEIADSIPPEMQPYYESYFNDTIYLDNAYVRLNVPKFAFMIGKQQISFGTGYFANPTDQLNIKDALDPTYEQSGHNALRIEIYPVPRISITALYTPINADWQQSGKLGRVKLGLGHFDISAIAYRFWHTTTDFYTFQSATEERTMLGADFVGELLGCGVWGEGVYNVMADEGENSYECLAGGDYTFKNGFYIMFEYHHNSIAKDDYHNYDLNDWMRYITGEVKTISRDQLYGLTQYPITDLTTVGSMFIFSISDQSVVLVPMINSSLFENIDLALMFNIFIGAEGKAFNHNFGNSGLLRATVYF
ncbi:MAG TPA: hypothetical protein ENI34_02010 [candidate division WOR-3 bacterium]|uniref:Uncharacterized protein n=1 Tax=candidate division WOR-3 bacterium TaxID=2052148 RepID=A0A9C9ELT8_UNCW3|nr:hypothetical protein [candidate division WOR-3 bacterium]